MQVNKNVSLRYRKPPGSKRAWCKKSVQQVFAHLTKRSVQRTLVFVQVTIMIVGFFPTKSNAVVPVLMFGDPGGEIVKKTEQACTLMCQLAKLANKFSVTEEGQTAMMWLGYGGLIYGVKAASIIATPMLAKGAFAIALLCAGSYSILTLTGAEAISKSEFLNTTNAWCFKTYTALAGSSVVPTEEVFKTALEKGIKLLTAIQTVMGK